VFQLFFYQIVFCLKRGYFILQVFQVILCVNDDVPIFG